MTSVANLGTQDGARSFGVLYCRQYIFLAIVFLLILNQLVELYPFRNMPPGPRLTSLPFVGNLLSFDDGQVCLHQEPLYIYIFS